MLFLVVWVLLIVALLVALSEQVVRELRNGDQRAVRQVSGVTMLIVSPVLFLLTGLSPVGLVMGVTATLAATATARACRDKTRWVRLVMVVLTTIGSLAAVWGIAAIVAFVFAPFVFGV